MELNLETGAEISPNSGFNDTLLVNPENFDTHMIKNNIFFQAFRFKVIA